MLNLFVTLEIFVVGGIDLNNVAGFISAGALRAGTGAKLAGRDIINLQEYELLGRRAGLYFEKIKLTKSTT